MSQQQEFPSSMPHSQDPVAQPSSASAASASSVASWNRNIPSYTEDVKHCKAEGEQTNPSPEPTEFQQSFKVEESGTGSVFGTGYGGGATEVYGPEGFRTLPPPQQRYVPEGYEGVVAAASSGTFESGFGGQTGLVAAEGETSSSWAAGKPPEIYEVKTGTAAGGSSGNGSPAASMPASALIPSTLAPATSSVVVVKMRGLPWETTVDDVLRFLAPAKQVRDQDIYLVMGPNGRCSGEAYVDLPEEDQDKVITELDGKLMGRRWIELFKSSKAEMEAAKSRAAPPSTGNTGGVLRLRGLPWGATHQEIIQFFSEGGFSVDASQIAMPLVRGRASGEAYVDFGSNARAEEAKRVMNRRCIGSRYIEIFCASPREFADALRAMESGPVRPALRRFDHHSDFGPYRPAAVVSNGFAGKVPELGAPTTTPAWAQVAQATTPAAPAALETDYRYGQATAAPPVVDGGFTVLRLRGLPFNANANDIVRFFEGYCMSTILPTTVPIDGRPSGEAYVEFRTPQEAARAYRTRQNARMERRYIELFPSTKEEMDMAANGWDAREIRARIARPPAAAAP